MEKKDMHRWNDSFYEALKMTKKFSLGESLNILNRIVENECVSTLEQSYYISMMYYVQNPNKIIYMITESKKFMK